MAALFSHSVDLCLDSSFSPLLGIGYVIIYKAPLVWSYAVARPSDECTTNR